MNVDFRIELDEGGSCLPGDSINGRLVVDGKKAVQVDVVNLYLRATTDGVGSETVSKSIVFQERLFSKRLNQKVVGMREIPFSVQVPSSAEPTYIGKMFRLTWELHAELDVPWAFDPKTQIPLEICVPAKEPPARSMEARGYRDAPALVSEGEVEVAKQATAGELAVAAIFFGVIAGLLLWWIFTWEDAVFSQSIFTIGVLGIMGVIINTVIETHQTSKALGGLPEVRFVPAPSYPGQPIRAIVKFTPQKSLTISNAEFYLTCRESLKRGSGSSSRTFHSTVFEKYEFFGIQGAKLTPGELYETSAEINVPRDARHVRFGDDTVSWEVKVMLKSGDFPDWEQAAAVEIID